MSGLGETRVSSGFIDVARLDTPALASSFRESAPFRHVVIDGFLREDRRTMIFDALCDERLVESRDEIYECEATGKELEHPALRTFFDELTGPEVRGRLAALTGRALGRADLRGFVYRAGHYLLPHSDHQERVGRVLAYSLYLDTPEPVTGGELELFACTSENGEIIETTSAKLIAPTPNRIVLFEVGDASLHQVREVLAGIRVSLSGWFYA